MVYQPISITLPEWLGEVPCRVGDTLSSVEDAMALALEIAKWNVQRDGGGPFGALVVDERNGRIEGIGMNRVVAGQLTSAHAELLALAHAQREGKRLFLRDPPLTLVTTAAPCLMCFGAVLWSGVSNLVIGARREDVERCAGFDEGPEIPSWRDELVRRGIGVREDVKREDAIDLLKCFLPGGGADYRPR